VCGLDVAEPALQLDISNRACFARRSRLRSELADIWNGAGILLITVLLYGGMHEAVGQTRPCIPVSSTQGTLQVLSFASANRFTQVEMRGQS